MGCVLGRFPPRLIHVLGQNMSSTCCHKHCYGDTKKSVFTLQSLSNREVAVVFSHSQETRELQSWHFPRRAGVEQA